MIAWFAERQHGVVGRRQLLDRGMGSGAIEGRLRRGSLHRYLRGVYVVGAQRIGRRGRWMAAVLAAGEGALLSHRSAAQLWGLLPPKVEAVDVTCPPGRVVRREGIVAHESLVAEDERAISDGIPVTSPFRTIFDLAGMVGPRQLERVLAEAEVRRFEDVVSLPALLERYPGRRGARALGELLSVGPAGIARSELEERFLALLDRFDLPRPRLNADVALRERFFEADCLWVEERLIVELDGWAVHGTKRAFEADRERDRLLVADGWRTMHLTWRQLGEEPEAIAGDLRDALGTSYP
ncbi:MAG TPA: DUF559 domain-containing protein [Solirubrobacterales bacterium]|nr:DUF559 domain-containing protein [Solirubrobacterales bacterium]